MLEYKIYNPENYYFLLRRTFKEEPKVGLLRNYKYMGGYWLVEFLDGKFNRQWHFDRHAHATYWRKALSDSEGKAEVIFPKYERRIYGNKETD